MTKNARDCILYNQILIQIQLFLYSDIPSNRIAFF